VVVEHFRGVLETKVRMEKRERWFWWF
jgi:hypothetical protein